jgi:uncharacterized damage-inducible protein DinB
MDTVRVFRYSRLVRRSFLGKMGTMPWDEVTKNREASYYSMKNVMLHMIDNEDWILNWVIPGRGSEYSRKKWEEYPDFGTVWAHMLDVERRADGLLSSLDADGLRRPVEFALSNGEKFNLTVEDCIFQSFTEQEYHTGELIALFWQQNIEPPHMQWFYFDKNV